MTFDSNRAWKEASEAVIANREVLFAIAGVFILLPSLAFAVFFPQPTPPAGLQGEAAMKFALDFYMSIAPWAITIAVVQAIGTLAMLALFTDRSRPTVGEALKRGVGGLLSYFAAQILLGLGMGLSGAILVGLVGFTGNRALIALVLVVFVIVALYVAIKTSLVSPVIMVEGQRNPILALQRSWRLTKGNSFRLALFYFLVGLAFMIGMMVVLMVVGAVLALLLGLGEASRTIAALVSSALGAVMTVYFVAILASAHRQLAGPSTEAISSTFE